jgi:gluconolactonase
MTRCSRWYDGLGPRNADGYIILVNERGARIVADGLDLANEVKVSADGAFLS